MEASKRVKALVVIIVVTLVIFIGIPAIQIYFHYECRYPSGSTRYVGLSLTDLYDTSTNVTISFVDDPTLMYSIDVIQSEPGHHHNFYVQEAPWDSSLYDVHLRGTGGYQISSVDVKLGTGTYYSIYVYGYLTNLTVTFSNGAKIAGQEVIADCGGGILRFIFTEDVNLTSSGLDVRSSYGNNLFVDIDLPDDMNGRLQVPYPVDFVYSEMVGWSLTGGGPGQASIYSTASTAQPLLDILHDSFGTVWGRLIS